MAQPVKNFDYLAGFYGAKHDPDKFVSAVDSLMGVENATARAIPFGCEQKSIDWLDGLASGEKTVTQLYRNGRLSAFRLNYKYTDRGEEKTDTGRFFVLQLSDIPRVFVAFSLESTSFFKRALWPLFHSMYPTILLTFTQRKRIDPVAAVAHRFLYLFQEHQVPIAQIPRFVPQLTLDKLRTVESLLPTLTGEVLDQAANLFKIKRTWIEGADDSLYEGLWCYKAPEHFFEDLASTELKGVFHPIRALFCTKTLDMNGPREQPLALLLVEKVADLGEEEILRYRIYQDDWDWGYWKCRIQLKAMARLVDKELSLRIPLYRTDQKTLQRVCSGRRIPPAAVIRRPLDNISLEDFGLGPDESACSKESAELPSVLEYIKNNELDKIAHRQLRKLKRGRTG